MMMGENPLNADARDPSPPSAEVTADEPLEIVFVEDLDPERQAESANGVRSPQRPQSEPSGERVTHA